MSLLIDALATCSLVGIWPRFIEPRLVKESFLTWKLSPTHRHLHGLKILHMTDLHFHRGVLPSFLERILRKVRRLSPDLILFTGDFLCYAQLEEGERLQRFLCGLEAPLGSFCSLGNHDYSRYVSLNAEGVYDVSHPLSPGKGVLRGLKLMLSPLKKGSGSSEQVRTIPPHADLCSLLQKTPFTLLENAHRLLPRGLNIVGVGDVALQQCHPEIAFRGYDKELPGVILSHNPDAFPSLLPFPGEWILSGHTHGEQIHFPWPKWGRGISKKLARLQQHGYTRGLFPIAPGKNLYVNRGLGGHKPFRFCSPPELCLMTAEEGGL